MATKQSSSAESTDTSASAPAVIASAEVAVATPNALMDFDPEALAVITDNISSEPLHAADLEARYNDKFVVTKADIDALVPKIELLRDIVEKVCEEQIVEYKRLSGR